MDIAQIEEKAFITPSFMTSTGMINIVEVTSSVKTPENDSEE